MLAVRELPHRGRSSGVVLDVDGDRFDSAQFSPTRDHGGLWIHAAVRVDGDLAQRIRDGGLAAVPDPEGANPARDLVWRELVALGERRGDVLWDPRLDEALALRSAVVGAPDGGVAGDAAPRAEETVGERVMSARRHEIVALLVVGERLRAIADQARERIRTTLDPVAGARWRRQLEECERLGALVDAALLGR